MTEPFAPSPVPRLRSTGLDAMRLIAAVFVIYIHLDLAENALGNVDFAIKTFCRWSVPAFFMLSGYFLPTDRGLPRIDSSRLKKVLIIILTANLLYLPLLPFVKADKSLPEMLLYGVWFHLWFLSALFFGLAALKLTFSVTRSRIPVALASFAILAGYHVVDFANICAAGQYDSALKLFRFLQAPTMLWLGWELAQRRRVKGETGIALMLLAFGLALCLGEIAWFMETVGLPSTNAQFPVGTLPMTFGMFMLFRAATTDRFAGAAVLGQRYSLLVYILHPIVLMALVRVLGRLQLDDSAVLLGEILLAPALALMLAMAVSRFAAPLAEALNGNVPTRGRAV